MDLITKGFEAVVKPVAIRVLLARERLESGIAWDLTSPEVKADPYRIYHRLRSADPVHRARLIPRGWLLTRYRDVEAVLRDHKRFGNHGRIIVETIPLSLLDLDPPEHTRLRLLVSKAFTAKAVAMLRGRIQHLTDRLLDAVAGAKRFDLIPALAYPLPITVIAEMLGVRPEDMDRFEAWSNTLALSVEPILDAAAIRDIERAAEEAYAYFETILAERRRQPRPDLVSALLAAEEEGDRLTHEELLSIMLLILVAGNETTRNVIGNSMLALLEHPAQMQRLRAEPGLLESAVDELLRYDTSVQLDGRLVREDVRVGGRLIRAGQLVICALGAANRDPEVFDDPDTLDIGRRDKHHLSFGRGIHYCIGAPLAVLEVRAALAGLLDRFAVIRLAGEPRRRDSVVVRGLRHLWLEVEEGR